MSCGATGGANKKLLATKTVICVNFTYASLLRPLIVRLF